MKKSYLAVLFSVLLCFTVLSVFTEEEISIFDTLQNPPTEAPKQLQQEEVIQHDTSEDLPAISPPVELLPDGSIPIVVTLVGDTTIGGDIRKGSKNIFEKEKEKQGGDPSFIIKNTKEIFAQDQLTIANFEGTLTTAGIPSNKKGNSFLFSAPPEYVKILTEGNIEAVTIENNHIMDHGEEGLKETTDTLDKEGIIWSAEDNMGTFETNGVKIGMLAYQTFNGRYPELFDKVPRQIEEAKATHDIVIVSFHWGDELDYVPNKNQQKLGRLSIDAGADLVVGHHSHRINPIEKYKGRYIAYSLSNFSFAGNTKPSDMSTFFLQVRFTVKNGQATTAGFRIIPARISSKADYNDFIPTPFKEQRNIDNVLRTLLNNGKKLEYAVEEYPLEW
ncbi:MAG: CapA family protein [Eubacteriales bacterium]|nr:CapA family protein [Eubacteriales bacterium]